MIDAFYSIRTIVSRIWLILKSGKVELLTKFIYSNFGQVETVSIKS